MSRLPYYDHIELSESELEEAILQGKIKKYFATKNAAYWAENENVKSVQKQVRPMPILKEQDRNR